MGRGVRVAGTTSDAGKSLVTAAICRWLVRQGVRVAPFKAQNMSNNSMVCPDGGEIGRAQWVQAKACRVVPEAAMNPVLLKPGSDHRSHVVLMGQPWGELQAGEFATARKYLAEKAFEAFADLSSRYDVVIAEGAGSPAEVNLRSGDYVNMGLARAVDLPVVVVGDIDRGGVLAAMYGTLKLLDEADQANIKAWIINKFRGDLDLLQPGLGMLEERTARPVLGVLPYLHDVWLDSEDSLAISGWLASAPSRGTSGTLTVAVVRFPRISNTTDVDALAAEPGVSVRVTADPAEVASANLVVLPGSRSTLSDLQWMRSRGLGGTVMGRAAAGRPVVGICGGYQMLADTIDDSLAIESPSPSKVSGLGLLPVQVHFTRDKQLGAPRGQWRGQQVVAYEIHHGVSTALWPCGPGFAGGADFPGPAEPFLDGWRVGAVFGTTWHGVFENDGFRRTFLAEAAQLAGVPWRPESGAPSFARRREVMLDRLADAVAQHLDMSALGRIIGLDV